MRCGKKIETIPGTIQSTVGTGVFADWHSLFSSHPSVDRRFAFLYPPLPPLFVHDHYLGPIMTSIIFCYCTVHRVMVEWRGEYRGCSLAPRRIIRCRYTITTFVSAKWKRFRFFAPAPDGRWLRFSKLASSASQEETPRMRKRKRKGEKTRERVIV